MTTPPSLDSWIAPFRRWLEEAGKAGKSVVGEVREAAGKKTASSLFGLGSHLLQAAWSGLRRRRRAVRSREQLHADWMKSTLPADRHAAVLKFLLAEPTLQGSFQEILDRRDYLIALDAFCRRPEFVEQFLPSCTLEDLFVDPMLRVDSGDPRLGPQYKRASKFLGGMFKPAPASAPQGNYLAFGGSGAGKTTLLRSLVDGWCRQLLGSEDSVDNRALMLPVYVRAADIDLSQPFAAALRGAVQGMLGPDLARNLDPDFFDYHRAGRSRSWIVALDGLDEVSPEKQRKIIKCVRDVIATRGAAFRFLVGCQESELTAAMFGERFQPVFLQPVSYLDLRSLIEKYRGLLAMKQPQNPPELVPGALFTGARNTAMTVAMSLIVRAARGDRDYGTTELYREFIDLQLEKRAIPYGSRDDLLTLVAELAESAESVVVITRAMLERAVELRVLEHARPETVQRQKLIAQLLNSGLFDHREKGIAFRHAAFRAYFRAYRFTQSRLPADTSWEQLDPYVNGWEFCQFVLDRWSEAGHDLHALRAALLSYGESGLRLFTQLAARDPHDPSGLVSVAISKWLRHVRENSSGEISGGIEQIGLLAPHHENAVQALRAIASDPRHQHDSVKACLQLHWLGESRRRPQETAFAHDALIRIAERKECEIETEAADALCTIGFEDEGLAYLHQQADRLSQSHDWDELLGVAALAEALHQHGDTARARTLLDTVAASGCDDNGILLGGILHAYAEIGAHEVLKPFAERWLDRISEPDDDDVEAGGRADIAGGAEKFWDAFEMDTDELLARPPPLDADGAPSGELGALWSRLPQGMDPCARAVEIARNGHVQSRLRKHALDYLAPLDGDAHRKLSLGLLEDSSFGAQEKRDVAARLISNGCIPEVAETLCRYIANASHACIAEAVLLAHIGRRAEAIAHLEQSVFTAADGSAQVTCCRALCEMGASEVAVSCLRRAIEDRAMLPEVFVGIATELFLTEQAESVRAILMLLEQQEEEEIEEEEEEGGEEEREEEEEYAEECASTELPGVDGDRGPYFDWLRSHAEGQSKDLLEASFLRVACNPRASVLNRLRALALLNKTGGYKPAKAVARTMFADEGVATLSFYLAPAFVSQLADLNLIDEARSLCIQTLGRAGCPATTAADLIAALASFGFSIEAREHARKLLDSLFDSSDAAASAAALSNVATVLSKLGDQELVRERLLRAGESGERQREFRLAVCDTLAQLGELSSARTLLTSIPAECESSPEAQLDALALRMRLRMETCARNPILEKLSAEAQRSDDLATKLSLLTAYGSMRLWGDAHALVDQLLDDVRLTHTDRLVVLWHLRSSPLQPFALAEAFDIANQELTPSEALHVAAVIGGLGDVEGSRDLLRALCDEGEVSASDRLTLITVLIDAGCDESALIQMQRLGAETLDENDRKQLDRLWSNWLSGADSEGLRRHRAP